MPEGSRDTSSAPIENPATQPFSWRLFWFLALAMLLAALLGLPYALHILQAGKPDLAIQADVLRREAAVNAVRRVIVFYWPMTWLGLYAAGRIGLGLPVIFAWLQGLPPPLNRRKILRPAAWLGFGTGFA
ncbi:MAG: hypothetical protein EHM21_12975, partial [Chloroflexi bacterium]